MGRISFDTFYNVINGELRGSDIQHFGINPFTEEKLWPVPVATEEDLDVAVAAGNNAFETWQHTKVEERRNRIKQFADALMEQREEWVEIISKETGQPKDLAEGEIDAGYEWLTTLSNVDLPEYVTYEDEMVKVTTKYYPLGLVAGICPWNFPVFLACGKIASAVSTEPLSHPTLQRPFSPYTELKLVELAQHDFPPGVIQCLGGDSNLGPWMTKHPGIAKISFTGSSATGKKVLAASVPTLKRVTLELGGNDPCIVCPDVDIDEIIPNIVDDAFGHAGQSCVAAKRIYVHTSIYEKFIRAFTAACRDLVPGHGFLGPVQNQMQYDKIKSFHDDCRTQKYEFALGPAGLEKSRPGYFVPPAIVVKPPEQSRLVQEEPFGPILPVLTWADEEDVIKRANATDQGLGATLWCADLKRAERMAERLEAGSVWVNRGATPLPTALFGGVKQSGIGGEWGPLGLLNYCNARTIHIPKTS